MYNAIGAYIDGLRSIDPTRRDLLEDLAAFLINELDQKKKVQLVFICTHNARRSQLSQIWAKVLSQYFDLPVETFSGGTEATAFHPNAVQILRNLGFRIESSDGSNPEYLIFWSDHDPPIRCYSKTFEDTGADPGQFIAVMTCSDADVNCPHVPAARHRISLPYSDPGLYDRSDDPMSAYATASRQIASEWLYILDRVKSQSHSHVK